jgi:hypothetical protein
MGSIKENRKAKEDNGQKAGMAVCPKQSQQ